MKDTKLVIQWVPIREVKENPHNPRKIDEIKYRKLVQSIKDFPQMLELRPLVIDSEGIVLGGNMRLKALYELGYIEVPTIQANTLTEDQKREFVIKDNLSFGSWDWEELGLQYQMPELEDWGLDFPDDMGLLHGGGDDKAEGESEEETNLETCSKCGASLNAKV